jgi:trimeric autotransporter adhesin
VFGTNGFSVDYFGQRPDGGGTQWAGIGIIGGQTISTWNGAFLSDSGLWQNASDRNRKTAFATVNPLEVLAKVAAMPVQSWRYTNETDIVRHLGPTAQDFKAAFGLGTDDKSIGTVDEGGVALAAIQGLNQKLEEQRAENAESKARLERLEKLLEKTSAQNR